MKKLIFISVFLIFFTGSLFSETNTFAKTIGGKNIDMAKCIQPTEDGGYIIAGYTNSSGAGKYDAYLVKINANGEKIWAETYGGKLDDYAYYVEQAKDGGYILTGSTESIIPEGMTAGSRYAYLVKTDAKGKEMWSKSFGQGTTDIGYSVFQNSKGGYIVAGLTGSYAMSINMMVLETDANGKLLEKKKGSTGAISIYTPGGAGGSDVYLIKTDANGKIIWSKTYGGKGYDGANSIRKTADGGFIIAGYTWAGEESNTDMYVFKIDNPAKIKIKNKDYSFQDFLEAGKNRNFARITDYIGESTTFIFYDSSYQTTTSKIEKEEIMKWFINLFRKKKLTWKYIEKDEKHVACWDDYPITNRFYFEKNGDKLALVKIEEYFPGL
ncbi:MAG: hypothetical protein JW969_15945 [Spirochaetales bacterium]|nr:hypothetical protein [Spirochaetales bacterium]